MDSQAQRQEMRFTDIIPKTWFSGDQPPKLRIRCYQMARATLETFQGRIPTVTFDRAVVVPFYGSMPYVANPPLDFRMGAMVEFQVDPTGMKRTLPEGAYILLIVPEVETEYASRLALDFTAGLVSAVLGRNVVYRQIFDNTLDLVADNTTVIGDVFRNPQVDEVPDLSTSRLDAISEAATALAALPENQRNRAELAIHWYAEALASPAADQFLKLWIALEALGMSERENIRPLNATLAEAYGISPDEAQQRFGVGRVFGFRSRILHRGQRLPIYGVLDRYVEALFRDVLFQKLGLRPMLHASQVATSSGFDLRALLHEA
jgi:hypothetical protein